LGNYYQVDANDIKKQ